MKNFIKARIAPLFGIIAIFAVIGFSLAACENNPFIGTWSDGTLTVTCTEDTWTAVYRGQTVGAGTYTPNGDKADFTEPNGNIFGKATVSDDTMTVIASTGTFVLKKI